MKPERLRLLTLGVPVAGLILLSGMIAWHLRGLSGPSTEHQVKAPSQAVRTTTTIAQPEPPPRLASERAVASATERAKIQSTYQNYRNAVGSGNQPLIQALRKILERDRGTAIELAKDELKQATAPLDRDIAQRTLDSLRN